jgi:ankyrin repeat protein
MLAKQCWDICQMNLVDNVIQIVRRGCNPNEESPRGFTPLSTLVLNDAQIEKVEELLTLKANINMVNRFGFSPLMMACRQNSTKMVHILMRSGASALQKVSLPWLLAVTNFGHVCSSRGVYRSTFRLFSNGLMVADLLSICCRMTKSVARLCTGAWCTAAKRWSRSSAST